MAATTVDLELNRSPEDIRHSLGAFNGWTDRELQVSLLRQSTYWVFDSETGEFGPSKVLGFRPLTAEQYRAARDGNYSGARFDGGVTHRRIESALSRPFAHNSQLAARLREWSLALGGPDVLDGVDTTKWQFAELVPEANARVDWSDAEVTETIGDYFAMLQLELSGQAYSKAEHRRELLGRLNGRSTAAVKFKHANISAVLDELGLPYISGYKPRRNYQDALRVAVERHLQTHAPVTDTIEDSASANALSTLETISGDDRLEDVLDEAPGLVPKFRPVRSVPSVVDWAGRDENNRTLGRGGENYIAHLERRHLAEIGRPDLALLVEVVATSKGDGLGYDIFSFFDDGTTKYIEVKTTMEGIERPFYISRAELEISRRLGQAYVLYRVFRKNERFRVYIISAPIEKCLKLEPVNFKAWPIRGGQL